MSLHVLWRPEGIEMRLNFQLVSDPLRISTNKKQGEFGTNNILHQSLTLPPLDWSFASLFDRVVEKACPVAKSSRVIVDLPTYGVYRVHPEPSEILNGKAYYDLTNSEQSQSFQAISQLLSGNQVWDIGTMWPVDFEYRKAKTSRFIMNRSQDSSSSIIKADRSPSSILSTTQPIWVDSG